MINCTAAALALITHTTIIAIQWRFVFVAISITHFVSFFISLLQTLNMNPVYIQMDSGTPYSSKKFILMADGVEIAETDTILRAITLWVESFHCFNLNYPTCISKTLIFIQRIVLNIDDNIPVARSIRTQINKLNAAM